MKKIILILSTMQLLFANISYEKLDYSAMELEERTIKQYEKQYFTVDVPNGEELTVKLIDLSADVDLYVAQGWTEPTLRSSDCKSANGGNKEEECTVSAPNYKRHNIMVYGFRDATYKIVPDSREETPLPFLGKQAIEKHVGINQHHQYRIKSKAGETVTVRLSELTADADLKLSLGHKVRKNSFSCKSTNGGTKTDECSVTNSRGYDYVYIDVFGFRSADYKLERIGTTIDENPCISLSDLKEKISNYEFVENVNTSCITDMSGLFSFVGSFNQDISSWDVSNVTNMSSMFFGASSFNQDISNWDVSNVTNMSEMFHNADSFNQDISTWDVSNVINMDSMFKGKDVCLAFNQDISNWNVSKVTNMNSMFWQNCYDGYIFKNHDLSSWDVSHVTDYGQFFSADISNNIEPKWK